MQSHWGQLFSLCMVKWKPGHISLPCLIPSLRRALVQVANKCSCSSHGGWGWGCPEHLRAGLALLIPPSSSVNSPSAGSLFCSRRRAPGQWDGTHRNSSLYKALPKEKLGRIHPALPFPSAELPSELPTWCTSKPAWEAGKHPCTKEAWI